MPNLQKLSFRFKPTLITHILLVTSIIVAIMLIMQYNSSTHLAFDATQKSFEELSSKIMTQLNTYNTSSQGFLNILEKIESVSENPIPNRRHKLAKIFTTYMENKDYVYSIYIGKGDGTFYEIINLNLNKDMIKNFHAPYNARWVVIKIIDKIRYEEFLDKNLLQIRTLKKQAIYNPSIRPWFQRAVATKKSIKTDPYIFHNLNTLGSTYAKEVQGHPKTVIALDIITRNIQELLQKQKFVFGSEIFIYNRKGDILTYRKIGGWDGEQFKKTLFDYHKTLSLENKHNIIKLEGERYFQSTYMLNNEKGHEEYLKIISPIDAIVAPYTKDIFFYIFISLITFIITSIPLIIYSSKLITRPIAEIIKENEKIQNRNFKNIKRVKSHIVEVNELSNSLLSMSRSIQKYQEEQKELMDSFIELIATAIDEKSKYTGGHCSRVPELSLMIMKEASASNKECFKDFTITNDDQLRELSVSAWLHDCGKVTTPEFVMDKSTKLETNYNRIHEIRTRFEVLYRDKIIHSYEKIFNGEKKETVSNWLEEEHKKLYEDFQFIANANIGNEFMSQEDIFKVKEIALKTWERHFDATLGLSEEEKERFKKSQEILPVQENLLSDKPWHIFPRDKHDYLDDEQFHFKMKIPENLYNQGEIYNLCIQKGTLNPEERYKIQEHIIMTIKMLEQLPFPENLKNVPLYAGAHHETLIGTGYPRKLTKKDMPLASRIIALADIFEALTASDRPYKKAKTLSESIKILSFMVKDQHIDRDLFILFLKSGIYKQYAKIYLKPEQIDEIDIDDYI